MAEEKENKTDEEIKDFCQSETVNHGRKISAFLRKVALDDNYRDTKQVRRKDPESGEMIYDEIEVPVPVNVRVTAAKTWKEMIMDKAVGDVKEKAKATREKGFNLKAAMAEVARAKEQARKASIAQEDI
jgi:hypothetical protein